jgi:hypothetical protein
MLAGVLAALSAVIFTLTYGRVGLIGPRSLALLLALGGFLAIVIVPTLKYPPYPPAVGLHDTVGFRTITYFVMVACSLGFMAAAIRVALAGTAWFGAFNGGVIGAGVHVVLIGVAFAALPVINEVPGDFPAVVLWNFRVVSLETQALLWTVTGIGFGVLADRMMRAVHRRG